MPGGGLISASGDTEQFMRKGIKRAKHAHKF